MFQPEVGTVPHTGLRYLRAGAGEPAVFLHGWGAFKELWWDTLRALAPHYTVIALDWPGHGSPPLPPDSEVLSALAQQTIETCQALDLRQVTLVGHSLGGNVAARVALERADLIARLVLVAAAIDAAHLSRLSRIYVHPRWGERAIRLERRITAPLRPIGARVPHEHRGSYLRAWARRTFYMSHVETQVLHHFLAALHRGSIGDRVADIAQPALIITGARDPLVHPRQAKILADTIPGAELVVIEGALHTPMDERPDEFQQALLRFLQAHPLDDRHEPKRQQEHPATRSTTSEDRAKEDYRLR